MKKVKYVLKITILYLFLTSCNNGIDVIIDEGIDDIHFSNLIIKEKKFNNSWCLSGKILNNSNCIVYRIENFNIDLHKKLNDDTENVYSEKIGFDIEPHSFQEFQYEFNSKNDFKIIHINNIQIIQITTRCPASLNLQNNN